MLKKVLEFYQKIYGLLILLTILFIFAGIVTTFVDYRAQRITIVSENAKNIGVLILSLIRFFIWALIFKRLTEMISRQEKHEVYSNFFSTVGRLFSISFIIDILNHVYIYFVGLKSNVDWTTITFPQYNGFNPEFVFGMVAIFFKTTEYFSNFLMPTTTGMPSIVLALFFFWLGSRK